MGSCRPVLLCAPTARQSPSVCRRRVGPPSAPICRSRSRARRAPSAGMQSCSRCQAKRGLLAERPGACVVRRADDLQVVGPGRDEAEDGGTHRLGRSSSRRARPSQDRSPLQPNSGGGKGSAASVTRGGGNWRTWGAVRVPGRHYPRCGRRQRRQPRGSPCCPSSRRSMPLCRHRIGVGRCIRSRRPCGPGTTLVVP